ncbi:MAG: F0F1 ATP synthase subunit alpha, partial [Bacteroidales bacterium]|nr:F0F1 ATP synthase subunit alpha [Bacteroidales bacterium]
TELFNQGNRPAIDVGISVSRVGGNAQIKPMKKIAGTLKMDQAQFNELAAFMKFGGDLDKVTAMTIDKGQKNMELLVQPINKPMSVEKQVALLYCGTKGLLSKIPVSKVKEFEKEFLSLLDTTQQKEVLDVIKSGHINDEVTAIIEQTAQEVITRILHTTK